MISRPYKLIIYICVAFLAGVSNSNAATPEGFTFIETNTDIERHHAEMAFLRSASNFELCLHILTPDFNDAQRRRIERLKDDEASRMKDMKAIFEEMKIGLADGGKLYWGERKDNDGFEKGYYIVNDGVIIKKWLIDWGVRQNDGSLRTDAEPPRLQKEESSK